MPEKKNIYSYSPRVNSNVSYGLWVMICQHRFVNYNKRTTMALDMDSGIYGYLVICVDRIYMGILYFVLSFAVKLKLF